MSTNTNRENRGLRTDQSPPTNESDPEPIHPVEYAWRLLRTPWEPPAELLQTAPAGLPNAPRIPLADVIRVLAFERAQPPEEIPEIVRVANRMRAAKALFDAAREGQVVLYGTRVSDRTRGRIADFEFDMPLQLDADDNAIHPDLGADALPMTDFVELRRRRPEAHAWRDVTVERKSLMSWLTKRCRGTATASDESAAIRFIASILQQDNNLRVTDAFDRCRNRYRVSERGFRSRIWPKARELAGLPSRANPGRKRESSH